MNSSAPQPEAFREHQPLSFAEEATRIHQAAQAVSQSKTSARAFLESIGIIDQKGELNEAYR